MQYPALRVLVSNVDAPMRANEVCVVLQAVQQEV